MAVPVVKDDMIDEKLLSSLFQGLEEESIPLNEAQRSVCRDLISSYICGEKRFLLSLPQGSFKTFISLLFVKYLLKKGFIKKVVAICPSRPLCQQWEDISREFFQIDSKYFDSREYWQIKRRYKRWWESTSIPLRIITLQSVDGFIRKNMHLTSADIVLVDEAQKLAAYSAFGVRRCKYFSKEIEYLSSLLAITPFYISPEKRELLVRHLNIEKVIRRKVKVYDYRFRLFRVNDNIVNELLPTIRKLCTNRRKRLCDFLKKYNLPVDHKRIALIGEYEKEKIEKHLKEMGYLEFEIDKVLEELDRLCASYHLTWWLYKLVLTENKIELRRTILAGHPLIKEWIYSPSRKVKRVADIVERRVKDGKKVFVFSEWVNLLNMIEKELIERGIKLVTVTANGRDQSMNVQKFNRGDVDVILSTPVLKAGINLRRADTVIVYTPYDNPFSTLQVVNRIRGGECVFVSHGEEGELNRVKRIRKEVESMMK